ncbi:Flagellar biosynthesis protein FlhA N-terminal domain protein [Candidatus Cyrtobacter comes]|uniref:Flagellar biosynthesis protein FlhA N-terminal domain protein n=1 Tax=Candidatus Cyrtobacter comes TaxID=675776 RepID=A0ABU5L9U7_9RICK|nr:flagellar biosynthesis protein FlhA [Candidatus Cyrtobacter comes]MDZ5762832.1 Flagellar biosynthesis protein FlhA N-terminal domain protein [Candidatus Cyrtobacter comes]
MKTTPFQNNFKNLFNAGLYLKHRDLLFAISILLMIGVLIFPVPAIILDMLLSISISCSVVILMTVLFIEKPLDLSSFPSILLIITVLRLSLNVSTTRLILSNGHLGTSAAGHVVEAFGYFVMQGSIVIGTIVFAILTIINFVVITKGSGRIAEVAARFSLDSMPGKQMAIDADLSSGGITQDEAKKRRKVLEDESTFLGAMDGANKFVRGDAVAGLLITFINFVAGIVIGVVQKNMSFDTALHTYTILTIGDGLVSQIPALIVSIAAALLVTKSGDKGPADKEIFSQLAGYPKALAVSGSLAFFMAVIPGTPAAQFMIAGTILSVTAYLLYKTKLPLEQTKKSEDSISVQQKRSEQADDSIPNIDVIRVELGYGLLSLTNEKASSSKITDQIKGLRKQFAKELGIIIPSVRIQDNAQLGAEEYILKIKEIEVGKGKLKPNKLLIMDPTGNEIKMHGDNTIEPAFGLKAKWIDKIDREEAVLNGYTVADPSTVVVTHLSELLKENISELLTYSEAQRLGTVNKGFAK